MESVTDGRGSVVVVRFRATTWLLATGGVFVGHILGYAVAHPDHADRALALSGHAYFGPLAAVVVPVGAITVLATAIRTVRRLGDVPTLTELALAQAGLFLFQELVERLPGSTNPLDAFSESGMWLGLVAQVLVAWIAIRAVHVTARVVRAVVSGIRRSVVAAPTLVVPVLPAVAPCAAATVRLPGRRGPPAVVGAVTFP